MITLNDYLYSGDTIFRILRNYTVDLKKEAKKNHNEIDLIHSNFLIQFRELLEHNDFLTAQSQKIRDFYKYMVQEYPHILQYLQALSHAPSSAPRFPDRSACTDASPELPVPAGR